MIIAIFLGVFFMVILPVMLIVSFLCSFAVNYASSFYRGLTGMAPPDQTYQPPPLARGEYTIEDSPTR